MENTSTKLSFPQRNWFLLCIIVAVLSPLVVHWIQGRADKHNYENSLNMKPAGTDTSYRVASPPSADSSKKNAVTMPEGTHANAPAQPGAVNPAAATKGTDTSK
jgi:hypothetical protein